MADVGINDIRKAFGEVEVIHGVSIDIKPGEFVVLVGPSGCGKSTLLRMIAGLDDPTSGTISIGGRVDNDLLPKERDVAMVFQSYALYPHMTVRENISFSLELKKRPKAEIDKAVQEASEILGLGEYLDRRPKALSGGQRQRVAMGRAIVRNPEVFLFDEPLSNLDAKLRAVMRKEVKLLHQRLKTTSVYVTHDQTEAMTMADKIVVMNDGNIEQIGSPLDLYNSPDNLFVASFIGAPQMNFLKATVEKDASRSGYSLSNGVFLKSDNISLNAGHLVTIGIRPEDLSVVENGAITSQIEVIEPMGSETHLSCVFDDNELRLVTDASASYKPNDSVKLSFDIEKSHIFDNETGMRVNNSG